MYRFIKISVSLIFCATAASTASASDQQAESFERLTRDFVRMAACQMSWNFHTNKRIAPGSDISNVEMQDPSEAPFSLNAADGLKYAFHTNAIKSLDICGWYFIAKPVSSPQSAKVSSAQAGAVEGSYSAFRTAAFAMNNIVSGAPTGGSAATQIRDATAFYRARLADGLKAAGLNETAAIVQATLPVTTPPETRVAADEKPLSGFMSWLAGANPDEAWAVRLEVAKDMAAFDRYLSSTGLPTGK